MNLDRRLQLETQEIFDYYAELIRDEALLTGRIMYQGGAYKPNHSSHRATPICGFNHIAVQKFLDVIPDLFEKEIYVIRVPRLRPTDSMTRLVAVVKTPSGQYEADPTIEEYFVDRSQDIDLVGTKIKRVYGPKDIYPFKILPHSCILPYQRR